MSLILLFKRSAFNQAMKTIAEIRLDNLERLIAEFGTQDKVAELAGTSSVYLSQIKNKTPDAKTRKLRQMGDDMARKLEHGCSKAIGWMDNVELATKKDKNPFVSDDDQQHNGSKVQEPQPDYRIVPKLDPLTSELITLFSLLDQSSKREYLANLRGFVAGRNPLEVGNAPAVAEK